MKLKRKTMCKECPFRKDSMRGWLGPWSLDAIYRQAHSDVGITCHMQNGKQAVKAQDMDKYMKTAEVCVGSILHSLKTAKLHHGELRVFQLELKGSPEMDNVLGFEFKEHHKYCTTTDAEFAAKEKSMRAETDKMDLLCEECGLEFRSHDMMCPDCLRIDCVSDITFKEEPKKEGTHGKSKSTGNKNRKTVSKRN